MDLNSLVDFILDPPSHFDGCAKRIFSTMANTPKGQFVMYMDILIHCILKMTKSSSVKSALENLTMRDVYEIQDKLFSVGLLVRILSLPASADPSLFPPGLSEPLKRMFVWDQSTKRMVFSHQDVPVSKRTFSVYMDGELHTVSFALR